VVTAADALTRAQEADRLLWSTDRRFTVDTRHRQVRDEAVRQAIRAGMPAERLADGLGVLISDVERMAATRHEEA
jgi:hypothetical protein